MIGEKIKQRRIALGWTQEEVATKMGYKTKSSVNKIELGLQDVPQSKVVQFADVLRTTPAYLMGWEEEAPAAARKVPVYGRVAAGIPLEAVDNVLDFEEIPADWKGEFGCLIIKGDSMSPRILDGDRVVVRIQSDAESGDIVIALINGHDGVCKRLIKYENGIALQSLNPAYEPMFFSTEDLITTPVSIWGKVVELRGRL